MDMMKPAAALLTAALLAGCAGGNDDIFSADPEAAANDTVVDETEAGDPMNPGAIDDTMGVPM
jgi:hypothetical protein